MSTDLQNSKRTVPTDGPQSNRSRRPQGGVSGLQKVGDAALDNVVWIMLVVIAVSAGLMNSFFLTVANFQNILVQTTVLGLVALAVGTALLIGEIDLSVIGNLVFSGLMGVLLIRDGYPPILAMLAPMVAGALIGLVNGVLIAKFKMNSLIGTLAMGLILTGAVLAITKGQTLTVDSAAYAFVGNQSIGTWPVMPLVLLVVALGAGLVAARTSWGRKVYATGGNERAASAAGIRTDRVRIQAFAVAGMLAGLAGFLQTSYLTGVNPTVGSDLLLYAVAAPVIGGVSLHGGQGRILGLMGGALLITVVQVALQIVSVSAYFVQIVGGVLILFAVLVDAIRIRRQTR
ncbi:MAG: transporter rane protein [Aeromicrobium sp.]|jgi:simple sugar transport system permease protein|nr:transporter rane protein [Aeromicrobium sp.]